MTAPSRPHDRRLIAIDVLRGIAVLLVVFLHIPHEVVGGIESHPVLWSLSFVADHGGNGVALFIVISGFCIHQRNALAESRDGILHVDWVRFWKRRMIRLLPPYFAAIAVSLCALAVASNLVSHHATTPEYSFPVDVVAHALLFHNLFLEYSQSLGNGAFWTLGMEEQLYMLYFVLLLLNTRFGKILSGFLIVTVCSFWTFAVSDLPTIPLRLGSIGGYIFWPFYWWQFWMLGALAADNRAGNLKLPSMLSNIWIALGFLLCSVTLSRHTFFVLENQTTFPGVSQLVAESSERWTRVGMRMSLAAGTFCLLLALIRHEGSLRKWLVMRILSKVGLISYSIYLTHTPVLRLLKHYGWINESPSVLFQRYAISLLFILGAGIAFYICVERPFTMLARRI